MRCCVLVVVVACGGSDPVDLTGVYRVDRAVGSSPCGVDTPITYPAFLRFEQQEFLGQPFFAYDGCTDASATDCSSIGGVLGGFFEPGDRGWTGQASFSSGGGAADCSLGLVIQSATRNGSQLEVEVSSYADVVPGLSETACDPKEAERRGTAMPCEDHTLVGATIL